MLLDDARTYGRPAFLSLPNGALLVYRPEDGRVHVISYASGVRQCDRQPVFLENPPREGWWHEAACSCSRCRPDGWDVG